MIAARVSPAAGGRGPIYFTAGEMTLLRALIVGPRRSTAIPWPGSSAGAAAGSSPTAA